MSLSFVARSRFSSVCDRAMDERRMSLRSCFASCSCTDWRGVERGADSNVRAGLGGRGGNASARLFYVTNATRDLFSRVRLVARAPLAVS